MRVQAYEGYWEHGQFYPLAPTVRKSGRTRAILTVLDEPAREEGSISEESHAIWHKRIKEAIALSMDEDLPDIIRAKDMRSPINLAD